jgi:hypothetical protein
MNLSIEIINKILQYLLNYNNYYDLLTLNKNIYKYFSKYSKQLLYKSLQNEKSTILISTDCKKECADYGVYCIFTIFYMRKIDYLKFYETFTDDGFIELEYPDEAKIKEIDEEEYNNYLKLIKSDIVKFDELLFFLDGKSFVNNMKINISNDQIKELFD